MLHIVGQVDVRADRADGEPVVPHKAADARVQQRRLNARVGADEQQRVALVEPGDRRVEPVPVETGK